MTDNTLGNNKQLPFVSKQLVDYLQEAFPVKLSKRDDTDFDRGAAFGKQELIELLSLMYEQQTVKSK